MAEDKSYHIKLNGKGYVVLDESYAVQPQRPFNPRFSTGDPSLGDLSFWQFLSQEDFSGGMGQEIFEDLTKFFDSLGWDTKDGKPRLMKKPATIALTANLPAYSTNNKMTRAKVLYFANAVYIIYPTADTEFTITTIKTADTSNNIPAIYHVNAADALVWNRTSSAPTVRINTLVLALGQKIRSVDEANSTVNTLTMSNGCSILAIREINYNWLLLGGITADDNGKPIFIRKKITSTDFTSADETAIFLSGGGSGGNGGVVNDIVVDSNGTFYAVLSDLTTSALRHDTQLVRFLATSMTATDISIDAVGQYTGFICRGVFNVNGTILMAGWRIDEELTAGQLRVEQTIIKADGTTVWRSNTVQSWPSGTDLIRETAFAAIQQADGLYFLARSPLGAQHNLVHIDLTLVARTVSTFPYNNLATGYLPFVFLFNGREYMGVDGAANSYIYQTGPKRGGWLVSPANADLRLSDFGGNTPLIQKSLYAVTLEISEALPSGGTLEVLINGVSAGAMTSDDGTSRELIISTETTGTAFQPIIRAPSGMQWPGYLKKVTLRFIPTQFKKLAWGLAVRAHKSLKLLNGQFDQREPSEIIQDLKDAWAANSPVDFTDVDGTEYSVIVTEFKARQPLLADKRADREYLVSLELLEV